MGINRSRRAGNRRAQDRHPHLETLEPRLLLSTLNVVDGQLAYEAGEAVANDLTVTIDLGTDEYVFHDASEAIALQAGAVAENWTADDANTVRGPIDSVEAMDIDLGDLDDLLTLGDATNGFLVPDGGIVYDGGSEGAGGDELAVIGSGANHGVYEPDPVWDGDGTFTLDDGTIEFEDLEPVTVTGLAEFTFVTPNSNDVVDIDSPSAGTNRIIGTSGTSGFEAVTFSSVAHVLLDTGANDNPLADANDVVVFTADLVASGLVSFTVSTGDGADTVDASQVTTIGLTLLGGAGDDMLVGGSGADRIEGGPGRDTIIGGPGDDTLLGQDGGDTFIWNAGDGSDLIEGGYGNDVVQINGSSGSDVVTVERDGTRVTIGVDGASLDAGVVEEIEINTGNGDDTVEVDDLDGTGVRLVALNVGAEDEDADGVVVNGGTGNDNIRIALNGSGVELTGLSTRITIADTDSADDSLTVNGGDGNDTIKADAGVESAVAIILNGDAGDDYLSADAVINGGPGNDTLVTGQGNDTIDGGDGVDKLVAEAFGDTDRDFTFVLSDSALTRVADGVPIDTDSLANIEQAELVGGAGDDTFDISGWTGEVWLTGGLGSDWVDFLGADSGITIDMDLVDEPQHVSANGEILTFRDVIENFRGTTSVDRIEVDALRVPRVINSECSDNDLLTVDGQREFVDARKSDRAGYATAFGYGQITFDGVERLAIVNTLGSIGFGLDDSSADDAYTLPVDYPVAEEMKKPRSVVAADVNADGRNDLIAIGKRGISVFIGEGFSFPDGSFGTARYFETGGKRQWGVELGRLNGDLFLDIVATNLKTGTVSVLYGSAGGGFSAPVQFDTGGKKPMELVLADTDGDDLVDFVITGNHKSGNVSVLPVLGDGSLDSPTLVDVAAKRVRDLGLSDFDDDGTVDVLGVVGRKSDTVSLFDISSTGDLTPRGIPPVVPAGVRPTALVMQDNRGRFLDFNGDGEADFAVADFKKELLIIYLGIEGGGFRTQIQPDYDLKKADSIVAGDLNSDGQTDLAWAMRKKNQVGIALSAGNGTFGLTPAYTLDVGKVRSRQPQGLALADFNLDGGLDLAMANTGSGDISVLLKNRVIA